MIDTSPNLVLVALVVVLVTVGVYLLLERTLTRVLLGVITLGNGINLLFLVFPFLIWAALRFQLAGATPCSLIVSLLAIHAAANGSGPFEGHGLFAQMVTLQAFNGTTALTALLLAAIITERNNTHRQIEQVCMKLSEAVARLAPDEKIQQWPPPSPGGHRDSD